jgi:hypothetical protein
MVNELQTIVAAIRLFPRGFDLVARFAIFRLNGRATDRR